MTATETTLTIGQVYDVNALRLVGWTEGDGSGHEGYSMFDYFSAEGVYCGPDGSGIEPIVAEVK